MSSRRVGGRNPGGGSGPAWRRCLSAFALALATLPALAAAPAIGDVPPDVFRKDQHKQKIDFEAMRGEVVVLTFWASWCGPCIQEMQMLANLKSVADERDLGLQVVAVNFHEPHERFLKIRRIFKELPIRLVDDPWSKASDAFEVKSLPNMWLIGRDGRIAGHHVGYAESGLRGLLEEVNALLAVPTETAMAASAQ